LVAEHGEEILAVFGGAVRGLRAIIPLHIFHADGGEYIIGEITHKIGLKNVGRGLGGRNHYRALHLNLSGHQTAVFVISESLASAEHHLVEETVDYSGHSRPPDGENHDEFVGSDERVEIAVHQRIGALAVAVEAQTVGLEGGVEMVGIEVEHAAFASGRLQFGNDSFKDSMVEATLVGVSIKNSCHIYNQITVTVVAKIQNLPKPYKRVATATHSKDLNQTGIPALLQQS